MKSDSLMSRMVFVDESVGNKVGAFGLYSISFLCKLTTNFGERPRWRAPKLTHALGNCRDLASNLRAPSAAWPALFAHLLLRNLDTDRRTDRYKSNWSDLLISIKVEQCNRAGAGIAAC